MEHGFVIRKKEALFMLRLTARQLRHMQSFTSTYSPQRTWREWRPFDLLEFALSARLMAIGCDAQSAAHLSEIAISSIHNDECLSFDEMSRQVRDILVVANQHDGEWKLGMIAASGDVMPDDSAFVVIRLGPLADELAQRFLMVQEWHAKRKLPLRADDVPPPSRGGRRFSMR